MFTSAQRQGILAEARANIAKRHDRTLSSSSRQPELIYKKREDAAVASAPSQRGASVASETEQAWWQWVDARIEAALEAHGEVVGEALGDFCGPQFAAQKGELELLRREVTQLREQVGLERGLRELRSEVEEARGQVPRLPEIVGQFKTEQARLQREVETTREKLKNLRVNQCLADRRLSQLSKATEARASAMEMKIQTTVSSFEMREVHPDAAATLRDFAAGALASHRRDERILFVDPGPTAGTA
jgi:hypothetical protein